MQKKEKLKNNDLVEVYNKRGRMLAGVKISNNVMEGVVVVSTGSWFSPHKKEKFRNTRKSQCADWRHTNFFLKSGSNGAYHFSGSKKNV